MTTSHYGSDLVVRSWLDLGIDTVFLNPGASISGIHDSLERHAGVRTVLALHENVALAAADGYARMSGRPAGVVLHNLVGLQSGSMGIFNAWVNQSPVCILGGSGPADATARRPWIDWVHTGKPQALAARDWLKWHDQPTSHGATDLSIRRAHRLATQPPFGPTYVAVDVQLQESEAVQAAIEPAPVLNRQVGFAITPGLLQEITQALADAQFPVIVTDLTGRDTATATAVVALAEQLPAAVIDLGGRRTIMPSRHDLDCTFAREEALAAADVVLLLDVRDPHYALAHVNHRDERARLLVRPGTRVIDVSLRSLLSGALVDYASPEPMGDVVVADAATLVDALVASGVTAKDRDTIRRRAVGLGTAAHPYRRVWSDIAAATDADLDLRSLAAVSWNQLRGSRFVVANGDLRGWLRACWDLDHDNVYLGRNLGAGLGYGVGASIGAAFAARDCEPDAVIVNFQNDGDLLYTPSGLWTAARYNLPILTIVVNNRMYGQDKRHAERLMQLRGNPGGRLPEGLVLDEPDISFVGLANSQGVTAWGPAATVPELQVALAAALRHIKATGGPALVDARVSADATRLVSL